MTMEDIPAETGEPVDRRAVVAGLAASLPAAIGAAASPALAAAIDAPATAADEPLMREALALAAAADLPFGAVIVRNGEILARGLNNGKRTNDPTAHGEMVAIRRFLADHGAEALRGTTLYTSGEPCPMCMGAIIWCGITRVVYAASIEQLATVIGQIMVPSHQLADRTAFLKIAITGGLLADEAIELFRKSPRP
ncbi:MAG TPA: nucleoside deaminase [Stellaceae bacterium]|nr:nucleoside deaminase [Stellaceae bacterium]